MQSDGAAWAAARYAALNISSPQVQAQTLYPGTTNRRTHPGSPSRRRRLPRRWTGIKTCKASSATTIAETAAWRNSAVTAALRPSSPWFSKPGRHGQQRNRLLRFGGGQSGELITITGTASEPLFLECGQHWMLALRANTCVNGRRRRDQQLLPNKAKTRRRTTWARTICKCARRRLLRSVARLSSKCLSRRAPPQLTAGVWIPTHSTYVGCPANSASYLALGSGAFLDLHNWYRTSQSINDMSVLTTGAPVFRELYWHQRLYAAIAQTLGPYSAYIQSSPMINNFPVNAALTPDNSPVGIVYQWDVQSNAQTAQQGSQNIYADMSVGEEFTPLAGLNTTVTLYQPTSPVSLTTVTP